MYPHYEEDENAEFGLGSDGNYNLPFWASVPTRESGKPQRIE